MSLRCFAHTALIAVVGVLFSFWPSVVSAAAGSLEIFPDARLWIQLLLFAGLIVPLDRLLFRPIFRVLEERRERVEGTVRRAEEIGADADRVLAHYESVVREAREEIETQCKAIVEKARRESLRARAETRALAEQEVAEARTEISGALEDARIVLRDQSTGLARDAAARVLGRSV